MVNIYVCYKKTAKKCIHINLIPHNNQLRNVFQKQLMQCPPVIQKW